MPLERRNRPSTRRLRLLPRPFQFCNGIGAQVRGNDSVPTVLAVLVAKSRINGLVPQTGHVLCQRSHLRVLAAGETAQIMSREIISAYALGSPLKHISVEHPVIEVAATACRREQ